MANNIFEELKERKEKLRILVQKAKDYNWFSDPMEAETILNNLENDTLCIGVIGQMKCGKSTFLNSFVFEDDVLPSATTPMTAALSVITYGEQKRIKAEFYTKDEWAEQLMMSNRDVETVGENEAAKIKAAKELVEKSAKLGGVDKYLDQTQEDEFDNLIEYVGADGKYVSITKSVTIYYPKEYLKGVEIVDTPGFNDPIVSREERTKEFLKKADVVLLMLYAGRPFDLTDRTILFKNVKECGIGKVLIGVNKYDIPYMNGETEDQIVDYVSQEIQKASISMGDESLREILKKTTPIPLSAGMALMSEMPMSKITSNEVYSFDWKRACDNFEITSQSQMREKSHIDNLINAIKETVNKEKVDILISKPLNRIKATGQKAKADIETKKNLKAVEIKDLNTPDSELEEKQEQLQKAARRMNKKIDSLGEDLDMVFQDIIRRGKRDMEDTVSRSCSKMKGFVESWGRLDHVDNVMTQLINERDYLINKSLPSVAEDLGEEARKKLQSVIGDFFCEADEIAQRYIEDFDTRDFIKSVQGKISIEVDKRNLFAEQSDNGGEQSVVDVIAEAYYAVFNVFTFGILGKLGNLISHNDEKNKMLTGINNIEVSFDPAPFLELILSNKDRIINTARKDIVGGLITPVQEQIERCRAQKDNKEQAIKSAQAEMEQLTKELEVITSQIIEIEKMM